jgi:UDP-glucose 4-epimerase
LKILVTGGAGFIGSHVVDAYVAAGHDVVVVDDFSPGTAGTLNPHARFHRLDLRDSSLDGLFASEQPDVVNHHAAKASVRESMVEPALYADVNVTGGINLLECCRKHKVAKFIYASTGGAVYGEPKYLPADEAHPIGPLDPYGVSKAAFEFYLPLYHKYHNIRYTILRYANVYGPRQDPYGEAGVVAIFTGRMLAGEQVTINGSGDQERDFVYVGDLAQASVLALNKGDGGIYNIGTGVGNSVNTLFAQIKSIVGSDQPEIHGPAKVGEVFKIWLTAERARRELGWQPTTDLHKGLQITADFFRTRR